MTRIRPVLVVLLFAVIMTSAVSVFGEKKVKASTFHSQEEAVAWITDRENEEWAVDYDGVNGPQCVDLIVYYWEWLTGTRSRGIAYEYAYMDLPVGWTYTNSPQPGDIAVWDAYKGRYNFWTGHVALVKAVNGNTFDYIEVDGWYHTAKSYTQTSITNPTTFIHPDFSQAKYTLKIEEALSTQDTPLFGLGTFDVYINGKLDAKGVTSYNKSLATGTQYRIENITVEDGSSYEGIGQGSRTGTVTQNTNVKLMFKALGKDVGVTVQKKTWNGHTYIYVPLKATWYEADWYSRILGDHLVTITSSEEENFIRQFTNNAEIWLGATDRDSEGTWKWISGEQFSYTNWDEVMGRDNYTGNDEGCENYLYQEGSNGTWNDYHGYGRIYFVCEIDKVDPVKITSDPSNVTTSLNSLGARFTVSATGEGLKYFWQYKNVGESFWFDWQGSNSSISPSALFITSLDESMDGMSVRCKVTDEYGNVAYSKSALLTIKKTITITTQPENIMVNEKEIAYFDVAATGTGLKYLWQYKNAGDISWTDWTNKTTAAISVAYAAYRNGMSLRCKITDSAGNSVTSNVAVLTYKAVSNLSITTHPQNSTVNDNEIAYFSVTAKGTGLKYLWQYKNAGSSTWTDWTTKTTASISVAYAAYRNGMSLRCVVSDSTGAKLTSNAATLTYTSPFVITKQPSSATVKEGELAYFEVKATGKGLKYLWQYKEAGKSIWTDWTSKTTASISVAYAAYRNGMSLRCIVTDSNGAKLTSNTATLTYKADAILTITKQPVSTMVAKNSLAYFSIKATGTGLKYQWQYKNAGDTSWTVWTAKTTADISVAYAAYRDGMSLKCIVTDSKGNIVASNTVKLNYAK
ncbi:MAG: CHAP domain-containing protein [Lachnospiraceae bacterium]|nr:CHAP domain-containing protein [Lachnospiraceae bacterium]